MITKNKIIAFLGLAAVLSCNKEEVEVVKNLDTDTNPSKDLVDKDIRTRLGYDPRFYHASFTTSEVEMPIMKLGAYKINRDVVGNIAVAFDKPLDKETMVYLEYDASVFDKVKGNYEGYSLGNQSLISFTQTEKVIAKGESTASFEFKMPNEGNEKQLVPYVVKLKNNDTARIDESKNFFVAKIFPKEVTFRLSLSSGEPQVFVNSSGEISRMANEEVEVSVKSSDAIPADISLGLVRKEGFAPATGFKVAPVGMEGTISQVAFKDKTQADIAFTLQKSVAVELGGYQIGFKLVAYADGVAYDVEQNNLVLSFGVEKDVNVFGYDIDNEWWLEMDYLFKVDNSSISYKTLGYIPVTDEKNMLDGNDNTLAWFRATAWSSPQLGFKFDSPKRIKGIRIKMTPTHTTSRIRVRTSNESGDFTSSKATNQGRVDLGLGSAGYVIVFDSVEEVRWIVLDQFFRNTGQYFQIEEIEFFEE